MNGLLSMFSLHMQIIFEVLKIKFSGFLERWNFLHDLKNHLFFYTFNNAILIQCREINWSKVKKLKINQPLLPVLYLFFWKFTLLCKCYCFYLQHNFFNSYFYLLTEIIYIKFFISNFIHAYYEFISRSLFNKVHLSIQWEPDNWCSGWLPTPLNLLN